jgi:hypothetical protein
MAIAEAKGLIKSLAGRHSILLLSAPGVGKTDAVRQVAQEAGLEVRSLLGTQIAPEDVSGIPKIIGERSVFCPPRILLPEDGQPFCLFLDELPACSPDIQKAFYSLLLERRIGEHKLPAGSWVVSAGNRLEDRALVRSLSSALVNRVFIINLRVDAKEWLVWAAANGVRPEILSFVVFMPDSLMRPIPGQPIPFSTPRAWASFSDALDIAEAAGVLNRTTLRALAFGRLTASDAAVFCTMAEHKIRDLHPVEGYILQKHALPDNDTELWFLLHALRERVQRGSLTGVPPEELNRFLNSLKQEHRFAVFVKHAGSERVYLRRFL